MRHVKPYSLAGVHFCRKTLLLVSAGLLDVSRNLKTDYSRSSAKKIQIPRTTKEDVVITCRYLGKMDNINR